MSLPDSISKSGFSKSDFSRSPFLHSGRSWLSAPMWLIAASMVLLSGCATQYPQSDAASAGYVLNQDSATPIQNTNLNGFLEQAPAGSVINLTESPWGPGVDVTAGQPYVAASGRTCRRLEVMGGQQAQRKALACQTDNGWVNQRAITESTSRTL